MKCDHCDSEATIHEVVIRNGKQSERHVCEKCAANLGLEIRPNLKVGELLQKLVTGPAPAPSSAAPKDGSRCGSCGTTYAEFRQSGLMGCADCYRAFEARLGPLLERAHEGASHHVGKVPRRALESSRTAPQEAGSITGGEPERIHRAALLRKQLEDAIAAEQYERAAKLRDELGRLGGLENDVRARGAGGTA